MSPRLTSAGRRAGTRPRMRARLRAIRARIARVRAYGIRGRTLTGGVVLACALLLALALAGGVGGVGDPPGDPVPAPSNLGPLTAVQPELRQALLDEAELPEEDTEPSAGPAAAEPTSATTTTAPPAIAAPAPAPAAEETEPDVGELCQTLLADALPDLWQATPTQETTSRHTPRRGGGVLDQVISVFETEQAPEAYGQLREAAIGCDRIAAMLDGKPATVLLEELAWDRRESASVDDAYAARVVLEGEQRTMTGWVALDRLGPAISVLRHLEPADAPSAEVTAVPERLAGDPDPSETRRVALDKLRALLPALYE